MKYGHKTRFTSAQLRALANRNSYSAPRPFTSCPLCGANETKVANRLEDHIAGHLKSLALKSLPMYHEELSDDGESEKNSVSVSKPPSRSTMRNFGEDEDMLEVRQEHFWDNWEESLRLQFPEEGAEIGFNRGMLISNHSSLLLLLLLPLLLLLHFSPPQQTLTWTSFQL